MRFAWLVGVILSCIVVSSSSISAAEQVAPSAKGVTLSRDEFVGVSVARENYLLGEHDIVGPPITDCRNFGNPPPPCTVDTKLMTEKYYIFGYGLYLGPTVTKVTAELCDAAKIRVDFILKELKLKPIGFGPEVDISRINLSDYLTAQEIYLDGHSNYPDFAAPRVYKGGVCAHDLAISRSYLMIQQRVVPMSQKVAPELAVDASARPGRGAATPGRPVPLRAPARSLKARSVDGSAGTTTAVGTSSPLARPGAAQQFHTATIPPVTTSVVRYDGSVGYQPNEATARAKVAQSAANDNSCQPTIGGDHPISVSRSTENLVCRPSQPGLPLVTCRYTLVCTRTGVFADSYARRTPSKASPQ